MKKLSGVFICLLLFTFISSARIIEVADAGITDKLKAVIAAKNAGGAPAAEGLIGSSSTSAAYFVISANYLIWTPYVTTTAGDVTYGHVYLQGGDDSDACVSIHDSSGNLLGYGDVDIGADNGPHWVNIPLVASVSLSAATTYWLGVQIDVSANIWETGTSALGTDYYSTASSYDVPPDDPITKDGDGDPGDMSIIFNNSSGDPS